MHTILVITKKEQDGRRRLSLHTPSMQEDEETEAPGNSHTQTLRDRWNRYVLRSRRGDDTRRPSAVENLNDSARTYSLGATRQQLQTSVSQSSSQASPPTVSRISVPNTTLLVPRVLQSFAHQSSLTLHRTINPEAGTPDDSIFDENNPDTSRLQEEKHDDTTR